MNKPKQIVVVQGSWNLIGTVTETDYGITISDASVIRKWGTTRGLGQIALHGATAETLLDPCGTVHVPAAAVIMRINCEV